MGIWGRLMTAIQAGVAAFNDAALIPIEDLGYDSYAAKMFRYQMLNRYYTNTAYKNLIVGATASFNLSSNVATASAGVERHKIDNRLYKRITGIYNPDFRLVEGYVAKTYGGAIDFDKLAKGCLPVQKADDELRLALKRILLWSNWRAQKDLYVRTGAKLGDTFIKIVDEPEAQRVRMELLDPSKVRDATFDPTGKITRLMIEYERYEDTEAVRPNQPDKEQRTYTYTEIITPDSVETFKNGQPFGYINDEGGKPLPKWDNPYGFVPVRHVMHRDEGLMWGAAACQNCIDKIDIINDQASLLNDAIRKSVDVLWLFQGMEKPAEGVSNDDRDMLKALFITEGDGVTAQALVPNLPIADTVAHIEHLQEELEADLPELAMPKLRDVSNPTAPAIQSQFSDAIDRYVAAQGNYDDGFVPAWQMAVSIAGFRGYPDFKAYNLVDYVNSNFDFYLAPRPIVEDQLTIQERINFLMQSNAPDRAVWQELNVPEDDMDTWEKDAKAQQQQMADMLNPQIGDNQATTPQLGDGTGNKPPAQLPAGKSDANNQP